MKFRDDCYYAEYCSSYGFSGGTTLTDPLIFRVSYDPRTGEVSMKFISSRWFCTQELLNEAIDDEAIIRFFNDSKAIEDFYHMQSRERFTLGSEGGRFYLALLTPKLSLTEMDLPSLEYAPSQMLYFEGFATKMRTLLYDTLIDKMMAAADERIKEAANE